MSADCPEAIEQAVRLLREGGVVAVPTETVYGLAADAGNREAVARIFTLKNRPGFNPLIIHCARAEQAFSYGEETFLARRLAEQFWPGPLSLVLNRSGRQICDTACAGLDTIALRVPAHEGFRKVLKMFGGPLAAPSANLSGQLSPVRAEHVVQDFAGRIPLVLDGGACTHGLESSIVDARTDEPILLRPGAIGREALGAAPAMQEPEGQPVSPGQTLRHYSPRSRLRLEAEAPRDNEVYLAFGPAPECQEPIRNLSPEGDLEEAASNLFAMLRELDGQADTIAVAPIPDHGAGEAINDRLRRGAGNGN